MLLSGLAITCFLSNATFSYNPVSFYGTLRATFLERDDSVAYAMCADLAGRLYMVEIELATVYDAAEGVEVSQLAMSDNEYFVVGDALEIKVYAQTPLARQAALETKESNFNLHFLDMDASVKQTLAYFAVESFNTADCFQQSGLEIYNGILHSVSTMRECDYSHTRFGSSSSPRDSFVVAEFTHIGVGTLTINVGLLFARMTDNILDIQLKCDSLGSEEQLCYRISEGLTNTALYRVTLALRLQLNDPDEFDLVLQTSAEFFRDRALLGCHTSTYSLDSSRIIFRLHRTNEAQYCAIAPSDKPPKMLVALEENADYTIGTYYYIETTISKSNFDNMSLAVECKHQTDQAYCERQLDQLLRKAETIFKLRFIISYTTESDAILALNPTREEFCFASVNASYTLNKNSTTEGTVTVQIDSLSLSQCSKRTIARSFLKFSVFHNSNEYFDDHDPDALEEISIRDEFSIANTTVTFSFTLDKKKLTSIRADIRTGQLVGFLHVDNIEIPTLLIQDNISEFSQTSSVIIVILGGLLLGALSTLSNSSWAFSPCRRRSAQASNASIEIASLEENK